MDVPPTFSMSSSSLEMSGLRARRRVSQVHEHVPLAEKASSEPSQSEARQATISASLQLLLDSTVLPNGESAPKGADRALSWPNLKIAARLFPITTWRFLQAFFQLGTIRVGEKSYRFGGLIIPELI